MFYFYKTFFGGLLLCLIFSTQIKANLKDIESNSTLAHPHIKGVIKVDTDNGLISCDLTIENIPKMEDLTFALNRGMNVKYMKINDKTVGYNMDFGIAILNSNLTEARSYVPIIENNDSIKNVRINYTGAFPVYDNNYVNNNYSDSQTTIAFKNRILRASYLTKWYPFIYSRTKNKLISKFTYNLKIIGNKLVNSIYINGLPPHKGNLFEAYSQTPQNLMLYIGDYKFSKVNDTYFLNTSLSKSERIGFDQSLKKIDDYFVSILNANESRQAIVLGQIFSIGRKDEYEDWGFAEYPALITDLLKHSKYINSETKKIEDAAIFRLYAHELAHKYWGLSVYSANNYAGFYSESFAEYFSLKAVEYFLGKEKYEDYLKKRYLTQKARQTKHIKLTDINEKPLKNVNPWYRYYPMVILGLEQIVGKKRVFNVFKNLLKNTNSSDFDYLYFKDTAVKSGITKKEWERFEDNYVNISNCLDMILRNL